MQKEPLVSINIITYNRYEKLKKALDSVVNQTYKNLEIIIADNHSEDGTEELCLEYAAKDPRIKYFRHDKNIGMTANANFAAKQFSGEYLCGLCDDDWLDLDCIEKCVNFEKIHPENEIIIPLTKIYDENYKLIKIPKQYQLNQNSVYERVKKYLKTNNYNTCFGLYKIDIIKQMQKLDDEIMKNRVFEDWVFMLKFIVAGKAAFIDNTYFHKLQGGWTRSFETTKELWDVEGELSANNFWNKLSQSITDAISKDKFFSLYLDDKSKIKLRKTVEDVIFFKKLHQKIDYVKRNPDFLFKKGFWVRLKKKMKL